MTVRRKGTDCDPCCNDWKEKLKFLWERYRNAVLGIKADSEVYRPDGEGIVTMPGILGSVTLTDFGDYYNMRVAQDIEAVSLEDNTDYWTLEVTA